jgi:hypothetical protein
MTDVYLACHVGFYLFEVVHYVKFQPNLVHWVIWKASRIGSFVLSMVLLC